MPEALDPALPSLAKGAICQASPQQRAAAVLHEHCSGSQTVDVGAVTPQTAMPRTHTHCTRATASKRPLTTGMGSSGLHACVRPNPSLRVLALAIARGGLWWGQGHEHGHAQHKRAHARHKPPSPMCCCEEHQPEGLQLLACCRQQGRHPLHHAPQSFGVLQRK